ncbi:hypothetical protein II898_08120 [bacterium]|nr:hypothetical protein [bacterium]
MVGSVVGSVVGSSVGSVVGSVVGSLVGSVVGSGSLLLLPPHDTRNKSVKIRAKTKNFFIFISKNLRN